MQTRRRTPSLVALLGVGLVAAVAAAGRTGMADSDQKTVPEIKTVPCDAIASVDGKANFDAYCAACHGADAKGTGPASSAMKVPVPDLTTIARRHGGQFDQLAVQYTISGPSRTATAAHGSTDMPIWGEAFRGDRASMSREHATLRIQNLVTYLESLQVK